MSRSLVHASSWTCPLCHFFASASLKGVVRHVGSVHAHDAFFQITCGISGCPRTYKNFHSYKKHMFQKHREVMEVGPGSTECASEPMEDEFNCDSDVPAISASSSLLVRLCMLSFTLHGLMSHYQRDEALQALFLMKRSVVSKVSTIALDDIIQDMHLLLEKSVTSLRDTLLSVLQRQGIEFDTELAEIFHDPALTNPFRSLQSEFLRRKFYTQKMRLLVCLFSLVMGNRVPGLPKIC